MVKNQEANIAGWKFFNEPRKLTMGDYQDAANAIISRYADNEDLLTIYDWGNPSQPGISDLDIAFVMKNRPAKPLPMRQRSFLLLGSKTRYIARHPFVFITEKGFRDSTYVYPLGKLRLLHGKGIRRNIPGKKNFSRVLRASLIDIIIRHYPRDFLWGQLTKNMNVRDSMLRLNSLKYTFKTIAQITGKKNKEWGAFAGEVSRLREQWFKKKDYQKLVSLCDASIPIMMDIVEHGKGFMEMESRLMERMPEKIAYSGMKNRAIFTKRWEKGDALGQMEHLLRKEGRHTSILPTEFAPQLLSFANGKGRISTYIASHLKPCLPVSLEQDKGRVLAKRIGVLNGQAELAFQLRHSDFPAFFDFGYRNTGGINNLLLRMSDKLRF